MTYNVTVHYTNTPDQTSNWGTYSWALAQFKKAIQRVTNVEGQILNSEISHVSLTKEDTGETLATFTGLRSPYAGPIRMSDEAYDEFVRLTEESLSSTEKLKARRPSPITADEIIPNWTEKAWARFGKNF